MGLPPPAANLCHWRAFSSDEISRRSSSRQGAVQFFLCSTRCCQRTLSRAELRAKCVRSCFGTHGLLGRQQVNVMLEMCLRVCLMPHISNQHTALPVWVCAHTLTLEVEDHTSSCRSRSPTPVPVAPVVSLRFYQEVDGHLGCTQGEFSLPGISSVNTG